VSPRRACAIAAFALLAETGCAFPQSPLPSRDLILYQDTLDAMDYRSALPRDFTVHAFRDVYAEACRTVLALPTSPPTPFIGSDAVANYIPNTPVFVLFGDASYASAVAKARAIAGSDRLLDVRADIHTTAVLGIWREECLELRAIAVK
jgi:hypothetical protein